MSKIIHERIARTAKAIAREAWERMAKEDAFYRLWPRPRAYVTRNWQHYIPFARQALVDILAKDYSHHIALGSYTPEGVQTLKDEVYDALLLDGAFKSPHGGHHLATMN